MARVSSLADLLHDFQIALAKRLLRWAVVSVGVGAALWVWGAPFWRGVGIQAAIWGAADAAIALYGLWRAQRRRDDTPEDAQREGRGLRRLLLINTGLDVLYVAGGLILALVLAHGRLLWQGHGWGIVLQGAFLFFFDLYHAQHVPIGVSWEMLPTYDDPQYQPFFWRGTHGAVLLVHGFPGTPAELRPLGEAFHLSGWTAQGILLPGFGPDIHTILERRYADWADAVRVALAALRREHSPVLLLGYSMGGALAAAVGGEAADGVILLAPFWLPMPDWQRALLRVVQAFLPPTFTPLARADLSDPEMRETISALLPGLDLNDPRAQEEVRRFSIPAPVLGQLNRASDAAYAGAARLQMPVLLVQGRQDQLVRPAGTRRLLARIPGPVRYLEVDAGHDLVSPDKPAWPAVVEALLRFADELRR